MEYTYINYNSVTEILFESLSAKFPTLLPTLFPFKS